MEELLDILDKNGNLTGQSRPRSIVHTMGLWHRTVHIYFYRKVSTGVELLLHHRSKTKDLNPNKWDTRFGGHLKSGDSLEQTIETELREEIGIEVNPNKLTAGSIYTSDNFPNNEFINVYFYEFDGDINSLTFNDGEVQAAKWMDTEDVLNSIIANPEQWSSKPKGFLEVKHLLQKL